MIIIRESTTEDASQLAACVDSVAREKLYLASLQGFSVDQTILFIQSLYDSGGIQLVCLDDDKIIGWCDIIPGSFEGLEHCGQLGMGLLKEYRGQGLGKQMLIKIIRTVFEKSFERVEL